ncbi:hypothetical protein ACPB9E_03380 [Streptomyces exfoliatus]|uniref:hypothetical protein n=1 Tax=Streptomyces exfoliatus TaxID=1905 RepID=UPI003C2C0323
MSHHVSGAAAPRPGRRRHAPARRGRAGVWLLAACGVAVLGIGAALLAGGGGDGGTGSPDGGANDGPPALIQADPTVGPGASGSPEPTGADGRETGGDGTSGTDPSASPTASEPGPSTEPSGAGDGTTTDPATAVPTGDASADGDQQDKPGRGRGQTKRPR